MKLISTSLATQRAFVHDQEGRSHLRVPLDTLEGDSAVRVRRPRHTRIRRRQERGLLPLQLLGGRAGVANALCVGQPHRGDDLQTGDDLHRRHHFEQELHRELRGGAVGAEQEVLRQPRQLHEHVRQRERVPV